MKYVLCGLKIAGFNMVQVFILQIRPIFGMSAATGGPENVSSIKSIKGRGENPTQEGSAPSLQLCGWDPPGTRLHTAQHPTALGRWAVSSPEQLLHGNAQAFPAAQSPPHSPAPSSFAHPGQPTARSWLAGTCRDPCGLRQLDKMTSVSFP